MPATLLQAPSPIIDSMLPFLIAAASTALILALTFVLRDDNT